MSSNTTPNQKNLLNSFSFKLKRIYYLYLLVVIWNSLIFISFIIFLENTYAPNKEKIEIFTATDGGNSHEFGKSIRESLKNDSNFQIGITETAGDVANIDKMQNRKAGTTFMFCNDATFRMIWPKNKWEDKKKQFSIILPVTGYSTVFAYAKQRHKDKIEFVSQIDDYSFKIYKGKKRSGTELTVDKIFSYSDNKIVVNNLSTGDHDNLDFNKAADSLIDGEDLDIAFFTGTMNDDPNGETFPPVIEKLEKAKKEGKVYDLKIDPAIIDSIRLDTYSIFSVLHKSNIDRVQTKDLLVAKADTDSYLIWSLLEELKRKSSLPTITRSVAEFSKSFNEEETLLPLHKGAKVFLTSNLFGLKNIYFIKKHVLIYFLFIILAVIFFIQLYLIVSINKPLVRIPPNSGENLPPDIAPLNISKWHILLPPLITGILGIIVQFISS